MHDTDRAWNEIRTWDDVPEEWLSDPWLRCRFEQGLPPKVEDPVALDNLATILIEHDRKVAASSAARSNPAA